MSDQAWLGVASFVFFSIGARMAGTAFRRHCDRGTAGFLGGIMFILSALLILASQFSVFAAIL